MTRKLHSRSDFQPKRAGINALFLLLPMLTGMQSSAQEANMHGSQGTVLEVVRQELVKERLDNLASGIEYLIRDMKSNELLDDHNRNEMARLTQEIKSINAHHVITATEALRRASAAEDPAPHLTDAKRHIDQAAREIGGMMIRLGIRYANEVFGRELRELTVIQSELYVQAIRVRRQPNDNMELPWRPQSRIAYQTVQLLADVSEVEEYGTDALAMVRLVRIINTLHEARIEFTLQEAAKHLRNNATDSAIGKQRQSLNTLMKAQFRALPGSEMRALLETREELSAIRKEQRSLRDAVTRWDQETLRRRQAEAKDDQTALRHRVEEIVAPPILEEKAQLPKAVLQATGLETAVSEIVPIDPFLDEAKARMADATDRIGEMKAKAAGKTQRVAEAALDKAIEMIEMRIDAARHFNSVYKDLLEALQRLKEMDDLIDQQITLKEEAEQAEAEAGTSRQLALPQNNLGTEVESFKVKITSDNQESKAPSDYVPLIACRLDGARQHIIDAVVSLESDNPADAVQVQDKALTALNEARKVAEREVDFLDRLLQLLQAVEVLETFQQYLNDLDIEQRQVREKVTQADVDALVSLAPSQHRLAAAAEQARRILDPGEVDMSRLGAILDGVMATMNGAEQRMTDGQAGAALHQQLAAERRIREARQEVTRLDEELDLLAEWIGFVKQLNVDAMKLLQRQIMLRLETEQAEFKPFEELAGEQDALQTEAESFLKLLPIGAADYARAAGFMQKALAALEGENRFDTLQQMALAEDALAQASEQLAMAMAALNQAPMLSLMDRPPEELRVITRLMLLVSHQSSLRRKTRATTTDTGVSQFEQSQQKLLNETRDIVRVAGTEMPELTEMPQMTKAEDEMEAARNALSTPSRSESVGHQQLAEKFLREVVLTLLLEGFELPEELEKSSIWVAGPTPLILLEEETFFAKAAVEGELGGGRRTEWRVLGERDRSALNQNFARELPLEYREVLRVYFERLSE